MAEMYTMQRFLEPAMEIFPDGASLRPRSRFARFTNLPEIQQMFRAFSDVQTAEMLNLPRPRLETGNPIVVACPMCEELQALQQELVKRYERLRSQKIDPRVDKLATDALAWKVNKLVENVAATWKRTAATRGTQMIFADMGVNPTPWGYSPYHDITYQKAHRSRRSGRADRRHSNAESDAKGDNAARRAEDIGGQELSYAEVKAIASGNPALVEKNRGNGEKGWTPPLARL